ncbi:hypothetical protein EKO04_009330 [Ascochyta lentis]|uniref:Uncharacterized protein n=1 Tax=Ascochyta lentis TaxID=205686 RepID=A0A8H7IWN5_9PLEO|nr:hypothetical protein EKO04_009330 [Ascochyta lentis]
MHSIYRERHPKAVGCFETIVVADMKVPGAFKGHLAGCEGVAHVASDLSFSSDPNVVITGCVFGIKAILVEARTELSIKSILEEAWAPQPYTPDRAYAVYAASKVACERAAWDSMRNKEPGFTLNTVLPNYTSGIILQPLSIPGAGSNVFNHPFEEAFVSKLRDDSPQWQVDVEDIAKLHLAALTFEDVHDERLFGFAHKLNYNSFLQTFRFLAPEQEWPADEIGRETLSTMVDNKRSVELLRRFEMDGWVPFNESVRRSCLGEYGDGFTAFDGTLP